MASSEASALAMWFTIGTFKDGASTLALLVDCIAVVGKCGFKYLLRRSSRVSEYMISTLASQACYRTETWQF